ncbi:MAG: NAD(P)(+) transhydrogenase (Re/Si-specific) subunit alpha, partial [Pseudomonadota bacterium]
MKITVLKDASGPEARVAATPDTVRSYVADGHDVSVVKGAGQAADFSDNLYKEAGASIAASNTVAVKAADVVLSVTGGTAKLLASMPRGAAITGLLSPTDNSKYIDAAAKAGVTAIALEWIPRISRAQSMDVLSSQSNLAGYRSVVEG